MDKDNWNPYEIISKALARGRLAHAYIISGNSPQAREQFIQDVAMLLLCTSPGARGESPLEPCGRCKSCHKAMKGIHPDLTEIRPRNRSIRIDQIKALQEQVLFPPLEAKRRIIAIHEADCLNPASANALLKLLEEPPQNNVLLLSVASPAGLLPTIVSRCQTLRIGESVAGDSLRERALKDISPDERAFADYVVTNLSVLKQEDIERLLDIRKRVAQFLG
ncbi:MAG: hypothetical protein GXO58_11080, partial [Thermodesulfobacteria bacterium]|nr:hypothetical protein [Thermodesulfobacteriota bacterium]